jgi:Transposase DDE domain
MDPIPSLPPALGEQQIVVGQIETFLAETITDLEQPPPARRGPGAPRVLPELCLWAGMLVCIVRGFTSQLALWRLLTLHGLWDFPRLTICDEAVYDRLERAGTAPLEALFVRVTQVLRARLAPHADQTLAPFAAEVVAIDETILDRLVRLLPPLHRRKGLASLPGRLATVFDLRRQQWMRAQVIEDATEREPLHARDLVAGLPPRSLILADLGYFAFAWFDDLTDAGYFWLSRMRSKVTYEVLHTFIETTDVLDAVVWLGTYRADRAGHAVRLVQIRIGSTVYTYLTSVLDPHLLPAAEIVRLYARRWDVELAFNLLKRHLKLHLLWSTKPVVLAQQIWATLTIAQVLLALWTEIAGRAQVAVFDVSLALLVSEAPRLAAAGRDPLEVFVTEGRRAGLIRPSRRITRTVPTIDLDAYHPLPPDLVLTRPARYGTGQGSIPITPAAEVIHHPPPRAPIPPERRHRGGGHTRKKCRDT